MRSKKDPNQLSIEEFEVPFWGALEKNNRWVYLAKTLPWDKFTEIYNASLSAHAGREALTARIAIGSLIIKHLLGLTDEETMEQIHENPYLQYFLGYSSYDYSNGFDPSLFPRIRKRLGASSIAALNEISLGINQDAEAAESVPESSEDEEPSSGERGETVAEKHECRGALLLDATVAPSDIRYPTDIGLLNEAREISERIIDTLYEPASGKVKPRTYRRNARNAYLSVAKKRTKSKKDIRKGIKSQLGYIRRNINTIDRLLDTFDERPFPLCYKEQRKLWIIREVYRQQEEMYREKKKKIQHRIVSISQPHVRPIVRGKANAPTEFGPKISASVVDGNVFLDRISWDAYNEGCDLKMQVEEYRKRFGHYPEVVITDSLYGSSENRRYLKKHHIRYSGKVLGRPPKDTTQRRERIKRRKHEAGIRNRIEGAFGVGKRRFGLGRVMTKLAGTSESWIAMVIFVMNISHMMRDIFWLGLKYVSSALHLMFCGALSEYCYQYSLEN